MAKILLVEDDAHLSKQVKQFLTFEHHTVDCVNNGADGLVHLLRFPYDLAIVDWSIPRLSGVDLIKDYRSQGGLALVLMLTGRASLSEKQQGLDCGADDYLTKPFEIEELLARVRALLRRTGSRPGNLLVAGRITLDPDAHTVQVEESAIHLLPMEFALLSFLMQNPDRVHTVEALLAKVWGSQTNASTYVVRTYVSTLRRKLEASGARGYLETVHGAGYRFNCRD